MGGNIKVEERTEAVIGAGGRRNAKIQKGDI